MPIASDGARPVESERRRDLATDELDDLIWDIAVGRPTRVVLDTEAKRATAAAVREQISRAVNRGQLPATAGR